MAKQKKGVDDGMPITVAPKQILESQYEAIRVPEYQRHYTWEEENVKQFFEDMIFDIKKFHMSNKGKTKPRQTLYGTIIGMEKKGAISRFFSKKSFLKVAKGEITICGSIVEIDDKTGKALKISPLRMGGRLSSTVD